MKPARRSRRGRQSTTSRAIESAAPAAIANAADAIMGRPSVALAK